MIVFLEIIFMELGTITTGLDFGFFILKIKENHFTLSIEEANALKILHNKGRQTKLE